MLPANTLVSLPQQRSTIITLRKLGILNRRNCSQSTTGAFSAKARGENRL